MKKIVLVTSGQPSLNPRLVKEADALSTEGFDVIVLYQYWNEWGTLADAELLQSKTWKAICVSGSPNKQIIRYFISRYLHRIGQLLIRYFGIRNGIAELAIKRNVFGLVKKAKSIKADLYIGHNLGALPAIVAASKKYGSKCGFDAEDFHRQEQTDDIKSEAFQLAKFIEDKYLLQISYFSAASPLIAQVYQNLYPNLRPIVINNVFPSRFLQKQNSSPEKAMRLFWFSQTVGKKRGLEDVILAIGKLQNANISFTILGKIDDHTKNYFLKFANQASLSVKQLEFVEPISPDEIFHFAKNFDIGLALETGFCKNNNIALSNKLFTYLTSGLAVIASETDAQKAFIAKNTSVGFSYPIGDSNALANLILEFDINRDLLAQTKQNALSLAATQLNWELESITFLDTVKSVLKV
ncbi:glycosyltransferase family protein [Pedobacter namyangjuensis]|uniref:hypothetical protein n=1 Tax=Pedobacter namyangjuensis TaxID=600626 RepID=UPI000DE490C3|nr:hypothetical protein [Pedobacter namyangjuensis]